MNYNKILTIGNQKYNIYMTEDSKEIEKGLMYIKKLDSDGGMLLSYENSDYWGIWMKNVYIPLDIVWISEDNIILEKKTLYPNIENPKETITYIDKKSKYTLEVNADSFKGKIGDTVSFSEVME
jgi:uncharacterized membrane protein (UPF0127 family)